MKRAGRESEVEFHGDTYSTSLILLHIINDINMDQYNLPLWDLCTQIFRDNTFNIKYG